MSNTDITTISFGNGVNAFTLSLVGDSINKTTNNNTKWHSEIYKDNAVTSFEMENLNNYYDKSENDSLTGVDSTNCPVSINPDNTFSTHNGTFLKQFGKTVWVYSNNTGETHVVYDVSNIKRLVWMPYVTTQTFTDVDGNTVTTYNIQLENTQPYVKIRNIYDTGDIDTINLMPFVISENENYVSETIKESRYEMGLYNNKCYRYGTCKNKNVFPQNLGGESNYLPSFPDNIVLPSGNNITKNYITKDGNYLLNFKYNTLNYHGMTVKIYIASETELLRTLSNFGLAFEYGGKRYYPVFENGVITGYTENINDTKDWYDWIGIKDHENANAPSNNNDLTDDIDDILLGHELFGNGFVNYFQVTSGNLTDISTAISNETGKIDLINNVISLKSYVVPTSAFFSAGSTVSAPIKLNGVTVLESAPKIVAHSMKFHIGDYTINGRYGNLSNPHFLDKNPYTIIELYIPFCGIVTLPDKCMYNTISVDLLSDLFSGGCIAVVKCNGAIVAEKSGIIGFDIPLSSLNNAELSHALINNVLKSVDIGANTIISGATGNVGGILSGAMAGTNNILSMYHTANQNYTSVVGNSGSKSEYALPPQCYVKIITKIVKYPDNYTHTNGKPCYKTKKLSDCKGFTMCENVNINVSATDTEKKMIKQLLETGVYI